MTVNGTQMVPLTVVVPRFTVRLYHCHSLLDGATVSHTSKVHCQMSSLSIIVSWFPVRCHHHQSQFFHCQMAPLSIVVHGSLLDGATVSHSSMVYNQMLPLSFIVHWFTLIWCHHQSQFFLSLIDGSNVSYISKVHYQMVPMSVIVSWFTVRRRQGQ